jgi:hypothetical protein
MTIHDLTAARNGLWTARLQRVSDGLEHDPEVKATVGAWRPQSLMVLAGYHPTTGSGHRPGDRFAKVWDQFDSSASGWRLPPRLGRDARRSDVQALLRATNVVLAARLAAVDPEGTAPDAPSAVGSEGGRP